MKIVLDTNTVISGLLWKGAPRQILDLARSGSLTERNPRQAMPF